jgi:hypothetical protein
VASIGYEAFYGCTGELIINNKKLVETIYTLSNCPTNSRDGWLYYAKFKKLTISNCVTSIGNYAFYGCSSLTSVYCKPTTPPAGGYDMFSYYDSVKQPIGCKIYVPTASVNAYKSAQYWSDYAAYIEGYDF